MKTLQKYVTHYNIEVSDTLSQSELAVLVARHFELETKKVDEEDIIGTFLGAYERAVNKALGYEPASKRMKGGNTRGGSSSSLRRSMNNSSADGFGPAKENELVAAKSADGGEEATQWILATVKKYYPDVDEYDVVDEDDPLQRIRLSRDRVRRLEDSIGSLVKGDSVLAVFPDTTSFYRGRISKPVKNKGIGFDVYIQFVEDEDASGRTPHRRVLAKHVMALEDEPEDDGNSGA
jgi:SAGA-associated factor 29